MNLGVSCKMSLKPIRQETPWETSMLLPSQMVGLSWCLLGIVAHRSIGIVAQVWKRCYLLFRITSLWGQVDQIGWCLKVNQNRFSLLHVIRIFPSKVCSPQGSNETSRHGSCTLHLWFFMCHHACLIKRNNKQKKPLSSYWIITIVIISCWIFPQPFKGFHDDNHHVFMVFT